MDEIKKLLGDALFAELEAKLAGKQLFLHEKDQKVAVISDGNWIPKGKFDEVNTAKKALETQIEERDKQLSDLKKAAAGNTDLQDQIKSLQDANKEAKQQAEAQAAQMQKSFAVKEHLMNAGVSDPFARDTLALQFDVSKVEIGTDGKIKGFDDMLKPFKENKAFAGMFGEVKHVGADPGAGGTSDPLLGEYAGKNPFSKKTLNLALQIELQKTKPDLAAKLKSMAQS